VKIKTVASVLGIAASVAMVSSSYGQGYINFANLTGGVNAPVTFATGGFAGPGGLTPVTAGWGVGSEFVAALLYSINGGTTWLANASYVSGSSYPTAFAASSDGPVSPSTGQGYFLGTELSLPSWSSGAVLIEVEAYSGSTYGEVGYWSGESAPFSVTPGSGQGAPASLTTMPAFTVTMVPEPATCALMGLGGLSLLLFRRRK
jgi:hypothetical protein